MQTLNVFTRVHDRLPVFMALLVAMTSIASAGSWLAVAPDGGLCLSRESASPEPRVIVNWQDETGLGVTVGLAGLNLNRESTKGGEFVSVGCPAGAPVFSLAGEIGSPALPVVRRLFAVPTGAQVDLAVNAGPAAIMDLAAAGFADPVIPIQAPVPMLPGAHEQAAFDFDEVVYATDTLLPAERAAITEVGIARGQRLYLLEVRPVAYNPVTGALAVWSQIDADIRFRDVRPADGDSTRPSPLNDLVLNPSPPPPPLLGRGAGNYLIVAAQNFVGSAPLNQFISAKTAQGFDVTTYAVPVDTSRTAIKSYILSLWGTADAPDYILLVGDAYNASSTASDRTIPYWEGQGSKQARTDLPYACMDAGDDWIPDCAIGRFSVRTVTELQSVVDKTLYVAAGAFGDPDYPRRATFIAGSEVSSGDHAAHAYVIDNYLAPEGFEPTTVYVREGDGTPDLTTAFNTGCVYGVFYGHSWGDMWQDGPPFNHYRVRTLENVGEYPFLVNFSCTIGDFTSSYYEPCYSEEWLRVTNGGAVVVIASSSYIYYQDNPGWPETANSEKFLFQSIYADGIRQIGPAWQAAMMRLLEMYGPDNPVCRDYLEMFSLLGDPSLSVPQTPGFTLIPDPVSQDVCSPPDTSAAYTIDVESDGGFSEPVYLGATGNPAGTTVSFSVNPVTPPGTTTMLVSNLTAADPGDYEIEIMGIAASAQDSTVVGLGIAPGPPDAVTLLSPPDGAFDVPLLPTMSWTESARAMEYDLEIATDSGFSDIVYSTTVSETSHTLQADLNSDQQYFWHVRAVNGCGDSGFTTAFSFTTLQQARYFTEWFTGELPGPDVFDLENFSIVFTPDFSADHYGVCGLPITELPTDPTGATVLSLGDDRYETISLADSRTVELYGLGYSTFYVGSNGYLTFGVDAGDTEFMESLSSHFDRPRISPLFHDLNPGGGGTVSWMQFDDRAVVTFENVPRHGMTDSNTFQVEMFFGGTIAISWLQIDAEEALVGLSRGTGVPPDFIESDLSEVEPCESDCPGDLDHDGDVDLSDLAQLLSHYGESGGLTYEDGDIDGDDDVDLGDLAALLANYLSCP